MLIKCLCCKYHVKKEDLIKTMLKNVSGYPSAICVKCESHGLNFKNYTNFNPAHESPNFYFKIERRGFQTWLEDKKPDDIVGITGDFYYCPISNYYKEKRLVLSARVSENEITVVPDSCLRHNTRQTDTWERDFVRLLDKERAKEVTSSKCLEILRNIN